MKRILTLLGILWLVMALTTPVSAIAASGPGAGVAVLGYTFNAGGVISFAVGTVLPLLVGLVTAEHLNASIKGVILLFLSAVTAVLTQWLTAMTDNTHFAWQAVVLSALITFVTGCISHNYVWKPGGVSAMLSRIGVKDSPETKAFFARIESKADTVLTDIQKHLEILAHPPVIATGVAPEMTAESLGALMTKPTVTLPGTYTVTTAPPGNVVTSQVTQTVAPAAPVPDTPVAPTLAPEKSETDPF